MFQKIFHCVFVVEILKLKKVFTNRCANKYLLSCIVVIKSYKAYLLMLITAVAGTAGLTPAAAFGAVTELMKI